MPITTTTAIAAARIAAPVFADIYKVAKEQVQKELENWTSVAKLSKSIAKMLTGIESVKTLWSPDKELSIYKFYYPSKILDDHDARLIKSINELPPGDLIIQGIVGQGKSIFMRYLASSAIRLPSSPLLPIFIELRTLSTKQNLQQAIFKVLESLEVKISEESFAYLANSEKLVLLLDAFDETNEKCMPDLLEEIRHLKLRHPNLRIIVSSRPGNDIQKSAGFRVIELSQLSDDDYEPFLKCLGLNAVKQAEIISAIASSPSHISGIIRTPLMMTLVVMVYETEREIPPTLPEFFERLFHVVFTRHDRLKAGFERKHYSGLSERRLQLLFEAFCFMVIQSGYGRTVTKEQFSDAFERALEYTHDCKCEVEKFHLDITKVSCLMLDEGIDLSTFLHKSILEYYAASFIRHSTDEVALLFYNAALENYRQWEEVLAFLYDIDPYRYARDYKMKEAIPIAEEITGILARRKTDELIKFIGKHQPEIAIHFGLDPQNTFATYFGPISHPSSSSFGRFTHILVEAMRNALPASLSAHDLEAMNYEMQQPILDTENTKAVTFDNIIRHFGDDEFWVALGQFEVYMNNEIRIANEKIAAQDKRKLIFERKKIAS